MKYQARQINNSWRWGIFDGDECLYEFAGNGEQQAQAEAAAELMNNAYAATRDHRIFITTRGGCIEDVFLGGERADDAEVFDWDDLRGGDIERIEITDEMRRCLNEEQLAEVIEHNTWVQEQNADA